MMPVLLTCAWAVLHTAARPASQAALDAHCLLWMLDEQKAGSGASTAAAQAAAAAGAPQQQAGSGSGKGKGSSGGPVAQLHAAARTPATPAGSPAAAEEALQFLAGSGGRQLCQQFERDATAGGWRLHMTMLNPKETRLGLVA